MLRERSSRCGLACAIHPHWGERGIFKLSGGRGRRGGIKGFAARGTHLLQRPPLQVFLFIVEKVA